MTTKKCGTCKEVKNIDCFCLDKSKKDGHQYICKECRKIYIRQHYKNNKQYYKDKAHNNRQKTRIWFKNYKYTLKCENCGFNKHPSALDFHHIGNNKEFNVSQMRCLDMGINRILKEISKCRILCANCHRILHHEDNS